MEVRNILNFTKRKETIVKKIKRQGFSPIYDFVQKNKDSLYKIAWSYVKSHHDIEDIFQNTIIIVYEHIDDLKKEEYFKSWFTSILINECKKLLRKNKRIIDEDYSSIEYSSFALSENEIDLQISLNKLEPIYKEPIILKYYGGFTQEEISNTLDMPIGTVKSRIYRGLKLLGKYMEDKED